MDIRKEIILKRLIILVGSSTLILAMLPFLSPSFAKIIEDLLNINADRTSLLLLLVPFTSFSILYLQSGGASSVISHLSGSDDLSSVNHLIVSRLNVLEESSKELRTTLNQVKKGTALSTDDKTEILKAVVDHTSETTIAALFDKRIESVTDDIKKSLTLEKFTVSSQELIYRLRREINDLRLRSNINLIIGMSITFGGLYLLWSTVAIVDSSTLLKALAVEGTESNSQFIKNLVLPILPRILLVVFVEVFAYFFLHLYRNGLSEIKYFQNELTNVESKLVAVEFAYIMQNQASLKSALESLSKTERNFILEKGQTTVELERAKSESDLIRNIIKKIPDIFKGGQSK